MSRAKHVPQRTCVGCRATGAKRGLVRVVRTLEDTVEVDATGTRDGRGAYLCAQPACWEAALKKGRLGRALRATISVRDEETLRRYAERFVSALAGA